MSANVGAGTSTSAAQRLEALAFALISLVPLGMAIINRSAQPLLVASALAALAARAADRDMRGVLDRAVLRLRSPLGVLCLAFLAFAALSMSWGHHPKTSLAAYGEVLLAAGSALVLDAALPRRAPGWAMKLAAISLALGCLSLMVELSSGMALRTSLGVRNYVFIFKRSVTAMLVLVWPIAIYLWITGKKPIALALLLLLAIAIVFAHSSAAAMGLAIGSAVAILAALSRKLAAIGIAGALALSMLAAPVLGELAIRVLPAHVVDRLHFAHADQRIDVWLSFGEVVKRRPIGGAGFGTSSRMAQEPVAQEVPEDRRVMLGAWHPHNGYLQIWAETGAIGATLATLAMVLLGWSLRQLSRARAAAAAATIAAAAAIMLVGHGVWQGWWSAVLGIAALWIVRLPTEVSDPPAERARP